MSTERRSARDRLREKTVRHRERVERIRARHNRDGLSSEQIASAAVAIADAQGVDALSMRKIAAVLGAGTMSLYHHVRTKEDLLAIMDDVIMGEVLVPERVLKSGWREALTAIARQTRSAFHRHPWALTAVRSARRGMNALRHVDQSLGALSETGIGLAEKTAILAIIDDYVFGHALRASAIQPLDRGEAVAAMAEAARFVAERGRDAFPHMLDLLGDEQPDSLIGKIAANYRPEEWFERGLAALLDGIAVHFALPGAKRPSP